jgi:competence protein ComGC
MNTISSTQNITDLYTQNSTKVTDSQGSTKVHHHHKKSTGDSLEISQQAIQALSSSTQSTSDNPLSSSLNSLVSNGTITQDQANSILSAIKSGSSSVQASGSYSNKATSPLNNLVNTGVITEEQKKSIQSAFKAAMQVDESQTDTTTNDPLQNTLDSLVTGGTITADQEKAIESAIEETMKSDKYINMYQKTNNA